MLMHPVTNSKSGNVRHVGYDPQTGDMHVEFDGGSTYAYHGVTPEHHAALRSAESAGQYLNQVIKKTYKVTKL